jgi:FixJ family two-component response regulator
MPDGREQKMNKGSPAVAVVDQDPRMLESLEDLLEPQGIELLSALGLAR